MRLLDGRIRQRKGTNESPEKITTSLIYRVILDATIGSRIAAEKVNESG